MQDFKIPTVKKPTAIKAPELPKVQQTDDQALLANLTTQYKNLEERLTSMGAIDNRSPLEKVFNLPDEQGPLMDFFAIINQVALRPVQGAMLATKDPEMSMLEGAYRGFRGQEVAGLQKWEGLDFAERMGWTNKPQEQMTALGRLARNIAIDVVMDPLTWWAPTKLFKHLFGKGEVARSVKMIAGSQFQAIEEGLKAAGKTWKLASTDDVLEVAKKANIDIRKLQTAIEEGFERTANTRIFRKVAADAPGAGEEALVAELMSNYLDEMGDAGKDLIIFLEKAADRTPDIKFARRVISGSGDELIMPLKNLEVKKLSTRAYGKTFSLQVVNGQVEFVGKNFKKLTPAAQQKLFKAINQVQDVADETGKSIAEIIGGLQKGAKAKDAIAIAARSEALEIAAREGMSAADSAKFITSYVNKKMKAAGGASFTFTDDFLKSRIDLDGETYTTFKELLGELFLENKSEWYGFVDETGALRTIRGEDLLNHIDIKGRITNNVRGRARVDGTKGRELRMFTELSLTDKSLTDATDEFVMDMLTETIKEEVTEEVISKPGIVVNMLTALTSDKAPALIRKPAQVVRDVAQTIERAFNAKAGLGRDFIPKLTRVQGEAGYLVQSKSRQLASLSSEITQQNAQGLKLASEIIEAGARLDPNTGQVVVEAYIEQTGKLMDNIKLHAGAGNTAILPIPGIGETGSKLTAKNMQDTLNRIVFNQEGIDDAFEVVEAANGAYGVILNGIDYDTLKKINFTTLDPADQFINFGRRQLSDEASRFLQQAGVAEQVDSLRNLRNELRDILVDELGFDDVPSALIGTQDYVRHTLSKEAKEYLAKNQPAVRSRFIKEGIDMLQNREYIGSIEDINKGLKAFYGLEIDLFDTNIQSSLEDLIYVTATRVEQAGMLDEILKGGTTAGKPLVDVIDNSRLAVEQLGPNYEYLASFQDGFGNIYKNMSPESQKVLDAYLAKLGYKPGNKAIAVHKSAMQLLKQVDRAFIDLPDWVKGYDKFLNAWKSVTLITPGFHMRNLFGNATQAYLVGMNTVDQARYARNAMVDLGQFKGIVDSLNALGGETAENIARLTKSQRDVYRRLKDFYESGISQSHAGVRDLLGVKNMLEKGTKNIPMSIVNMNFNLAERMDDVQRYMLYQWSFDQNFGKLRKQFTDDIARLKARNLANQTVSNALFDYKNFTTFEKDVMKRVFPFYTFLKNNLVFQMQQIFKNPGAYGRLGRAYNYSVEEITGVSANDLPDYMSGNMWIPIPAMFGANDTEAINFLKANLPVGEFFEVIENPLKRGATSLAAPLKLPLELGVGIEFFTGQEIKEFPGQTARLEEEGFLAGLRGERGEFALSSDPVVQKIANDLGLRVPKQFLGVLFDVADSVTSRQTSVEGVMDVLEGLGLTATKPVSEINVTELYQDLERLRNLRKYWEQETGQDLPTLDELRAPQVKLPRL